MPLTLSSSFIVPGKILGRETHAPKPRTVFGLLALAVTCFILIVVNADAVTAPEKDQTMNPIYHQAGKLDDNVTGWTFLPAKNPGGETYNASEGYYPDKGGQLKGPAVPAVDGAFHFYSISFTAQAPERCYWGTFFIDQAGKPLVADVYSSVFASAKPVDYESVVYGREGAMAMQPFFQSVHGVEAWNLRLEKITPAAAGTWCDQLYATLPPVSCTPPTQHLEKLPKTVDALKTGKPWRVVMLGDSIINDTFNSNFEALIQRLYPQSNFHYLDSVRGGTGCWFYQDPAQFKTYVEDLKPDLLIIGGISQKGDIAAIRSVIEQTKAKVGCEILLLSGPLGEDWRPYDAANPDAKLAAMKWRGDPFNDQLAQLAWEENIEYFDIGTVWHNYLGASGMPWHFYHRDKAHGNDRGKQIVARILEAYFQR